MGLGKTYSADYLIDSNGNSGVSGQVLISTATGIDWSDGSSIIGGPFLPLAGGTMTGNTIHNDNAKSIYGTASDGLQIFHNGIDSYILDSGTGDLYVEASTNFFVRNSDNGEVWIKGTDSGVSLRFQDSQKLITTNTGVTITGGWVTNGVSVATANVEHTDNTKSLFGNGNDLAIYHDGSNSYIDDASGTGSLYINTNALRIVSANKGENMIRAFEDGGVVLSHNNVDKLQTTTDGITIGGKISLNGKITGLIAGTANTDAVNLQQLNDATTGALIFKGTWAAGTTGVTNAAISTTTITLTTAPANAIAVGDIVTADGITAVIKVTAIGSTTSVTVDAAVTIATGITVTFSPAGGYPDLTQASLKITGNYYICETAGVATPNGTGTTPNEWAVGDWVAFSDLTTDAWQKIDNSSVLSGAGAGGSLAAWSGSGTSVTLQAAPATFSGDNTTFAGSINMTDNKPINYGGQTMFTHTGSQTRIGDNTSSNVLTIGGGNSTFTGNVNLTGGALSISGDGSNAATLTESSIGIFTIAAADDIILDAAGDITFDADGGDIRLKDGGTEFGRFSNSASSLQIFAPVQDKDINFVGNDGGTTITALSLDMSSGGNATFAGAVGVGVSAGSNAKLEVVSTSGEVFRADSASGAFRLVVDQTGVNTQGVLSHTGNATFTGTITTGGDLTIGGTGGLFIPEYIYHSGDTNTFYGFPSNDTIAFTTAGSERMRIDSAGEVGIGKTSSLGGHRLSILKASNQQLGLYYDETHLVAIGAKSTGDAQIYAWNGSSYRNILLGMDGNAAGGNVGIGTASPGYSLEIESNGSAGRARVYADGNGAVFSANGDVQFFTNNTAYTTSFYSANKVSVNMRILDNGNVGIGTTNPSEKLHVASTAGFIATFQSTTATDFRPIRWLNSAGQNVGFLGNNGSTNEFSLVAQDRPLRFGTGNGGAERMRITSGGIVKIGGTDAGYSSTLLHTGNYSAAQSGINILNSDTGYGYILFGDGDGGASYTGQIAYKHGDEFMAFNTNAEERMRIISDGNVGIGTANPKGKLHVLNGTAASYTPNSEADTLVIESADPGGISLIGTGSGGSAKTSLMFGTTSDVDMARLTYDGNNSVFTIGTTVASNNVAFTSGNSVEAMRITSNSNVLIGKTADDGTTQGVNLGVGGAVSIVRTNGAPLTLRRDSSNVIQIFRRDATLVGRIDVTTNSTSYGTSSDYRLKEDLQDFNGLDIISKIKMYNFKWKNEDERSYGVVAHELQAEFPQAVAGNKDDVEMQGVDYSKLVPLLVKSVQELTEEIKLLKQQINK